MINPTINNAILPELIQDNPEDIPLCARRGSRRALSAGFNMFVPKPVEPAELINAIANLAEASLQNRQPIS